MEQFNHEVTISKVSGSHFEIGEQLGKKAKQKYGPRYIDDALESIKDTSLYELLGMEFDLTPDYVSRVFPIVEGIIAGIHPLLLEEIRGFAESMGEDYRRLVVYTSNFGKAAGCTQFFVNGFLSRNYDDAPTSTENEFLYCVPDGSFASLGSSTSYVERLDGINEKGLAVSLTYGAGHPAKTHGIGAAMFQRIVLDKASSVDEALDLFDKVPYVAPNNVMIADPSGRAVVIEVSAGKHRVRNADGRILVCANSYGHPEMQDQQYIKNSTTTWREKQTAGVENRLRDEKSIMDFLTSDFPVGVFEPYFEDGLGTIWSAIYHPESRSVHIAIGEKDKGRQEVKFSLADPKTLANLPVTLRTQLTNVSLEERMPKFK